jgi:putative endonuclease
MQREAIAEEALAHRGYTIIERNWRGGGGEVDRIAWNEGVLCFIEVRARATGTFGTPAATVNWAKQRRVVRAAATYLAQLRPGLRPMARFDVVSIIDAGDGPPSIELIKNAFDAYR